MAPTRPDPPPNSAGSRRQRGSLQRVKKRKRSPKEDDHMGRGRKKTWSLPWLKRLVVLRVCGLHFSEIFEMLSVLSGGTTPKIERTAQHNMKKLLGDGWKELCALDAATTRKHFNLLVESEQRRLERKAARRATPTHRSNASSGTTSSEDSAISKYEVQSPPVLKFRPMEIQIPGIHWTPDMRRWPEEPYRISSPVESTMTYTPDICTPLKSPVQRLRFSPCESIRPRSVSHTENWPLSNDHKESFSTPRCKSAESSPDPLANGDFRRDNDDRCASIDSVRSSKLSDVLRRFGHTSSERSLVKRALRLRYSFSSYETSTPYSFLEEPVNIAEPRGTSPFLAKLTEEEDVTWRPPTILRQLCDRIVSQNTQLARECCSMDSECIHRHVASAISGDTRRKNRLSRMFEEIEMERESFYRATGVYPNDKVCRQNTTDTSGRNALFFAAGLAAPMSVLQELIRQTLDINAVDNDQQTFIYHLDLAGIATEKCQCSSYLPWLLRPGSSSTTSDDSTENDYHAHTSAFECLMELLDHVDFDFTHTDNDHKTFLSWLCLSPHFKPEWLCALMSRSTRWTQLILDLSRLRDSSNLSFTDCLSLGDRAILAECISVVPGTLSSMDPYLCDFDIRVPSYRNRVLELLEDAYDVRNDDDDMLAAARNLYSQGANFTSPSQDGRTPLSEARRCKCYKTCEFLQSLRVAPCGPVPLCSTAQSFTMSVFNLERKAKGSATTLTARSMKSVVKLFRPNLK
ncbi:hypothetical protein P280DRAFT_195228 [Massarina eburnea CBS 473.64]|uniref:Uncharacterized protein n=1 Tax=Massarina eburnea CBS 473.64 TaxID=1395130 RepID=A0A6A6RIT0_9PLEO|nr:hypothetical protein P280DRAFT_195228 [Massarina eburnea CBS 473.64]